MTNNKAWEEDSIKVNDADGNLAATSVLAPNIRPPANTVVPFAEQDTLNSQQEINWFLYDEIQRIRNELNLGD